MDEFHVWLYVWGFLISALYQIEVVPGASKNFATVILALAWPVSLPVICILAVISWIEDRASGS